MVTRPRSWRTWGGSVFVSMLTATAGLALRAASRRAGRAMCGARTNVGMTSSSPVQWNQVGTTRGVPSGAM
jgi:hypothetical protein